MATTTRPLALTINPLNAGVFPSTLKRIGTNRDHPCIILTDDGTDVAFEAIGFVPSEYDQSASTPKIKLYWCGSNTSGDVRWKVAIRCITGNDTTSLDQATYAETIELTDTVSSTTMRQMIAELTFTNTNFTAGGQLQMQIGADGADAAQTYASGTGGSDEFAIVGVGLEFDDGS